MTTSTRKGRLLLIEDDESVRKSMERFLSLDGFDTLSAGSAAEAETLFASLRPDDIVITDFHLDRKHNGLDLLLNLRRRIGRDVPAIIVSGDLPTLLTSLKVRVAHCRFLSKPIDLNALLEAISDLRDELG